MRQCAITMCNTSNKQPFNWELNKITFEVLAWSHVQNQPLNMLLFGGVGWVESGWSKHSKLLNLSINDESSQNKQTTYVAQEVLLLLLTVLWEIHRKGWLDQSGPEGEHEVPFLSREPQLHDSRWLLRAARNGGFYEQVVAWLIERRAVCTMQLSEMGWCAILRRHSIIRCCHQSGGFERLISSGE